MNEPDDLENEHFSKTYKSKEKKSADVGADCAEHDVEQLLEE